MVQTVRLTRASRASGSSVALQLASPAAWAPPGSVPKSRPWLRESSRLCSARHRTGAGLSAENWKHFGCERRGPALGGSNGSGELARISREERPAEHRLIRNRVKVDSRAKYLHDFNHTPYWEHNGPHESGSPDRRRSGFLYDDCSRAGLRGLSDRGPRDVLRRFAGFPRRRRPMGSGSLL